MMRARDVLDMVPESSWDINDIRGPADAKKVKVGDILTAKTPNEKGKGKVTGIQSCPLASTKLTQGDALWTMKALTKMTFKRGTIEKGATFVWGPWGAARSLDDYKAKETLN